MSVSTADAFGCLLYEIALCGLPKFGPKIPPPEFPRQCHDLSTEPCNDTDDRLVPYRER